MLDYITDTLRAFLEGIRAWVLGQGWLDFMHAWIASVDVSTIWAILVIALAVVLLTIFFWPAGKKPPQVG